MIRCLAVYRAALLQGVCMSTLFGNPPTVEFRPEQTHCSGCGATLTVRKTRTRTVSTLHVGPFRAREVFLHCDACGHTQRSEALGALVPPGANFGYDVMVYAGNALFLRHRNEAEVVAELAEKNVRISPREVSLLAMKFIVYLALAHQRRAPELHADMQTRGGYICHLDATCEGGDPFLMSSIDSLSNIVLGNVKLPAEDEAHIVPFLERLKVAFGVPLALVHDMGSGILKAVAKVFPGVADFICHFHFLRDIGKDYLGAEYDTIRKRLSGHGISATLRYRAKQLKREMDANPAMIAALQHGLESVALPAEDCAFTPVVGAYTLIQWALCAKAEGDGYGFPFDHPHLAFAQRLQRLHMHIERIKDIHLRGLWRDNIPYFKIHVALKPIMKDQALWKAVAAVEDKAIVFEKLRQAMRIALPTGPHGLNDEGGTGNIRTIEKRVTAFRAWLTRRKDYPQDRAAGKMIEQIDKYWEKLFADPITVQTTSGPILIQPQRTNNILEQFFRSLKRASRRRTGNASSGRMLRTILAETPLVRNLENPHYMQLLLNGKPSIEAVFAEIEIDTLRKAFRDAQDHPERIPAKLKPIIAMPDFPQKLVSMTERAAA
ncbi:MAG: transposase [Verrucomicrobia bacterium]|nr:transposase [Verrucomicrobiota bacterium]